jgi:glycosyltransferase involved in cell wall biosynthesis
VVRLQRGPTLRILQVHNHYTERGGEDALFEMQVALLRRGGHDVDIFTTSNTRSVASAGQLLLAPWNPLSARKLVERAESFGADLAHIHNTWFRLSPSILRGLTNAGVKTVLHLHNYRLLCANALLFRDGRICLDCVGRGSSPGVRHRCYRGLAPSVVAATTIRTWQSSGVVENDVNAFIVPTGWAKSLFIRGGLPGDRIHVVPHFVADPGPRLISPEASRDVLFVGRLSQEKGIVELLDAWATLNTDMRLIVIGDGPLYERVKSAEGPSISVLGWMDPEIVNEFMMHSRALILPSLVFESYGMVALEAAAAGLPIQIGPNAPIADEIDASGSGWILSRHPAQWPESLVRLEDDSAVAAASVAAREFYESKHTPNAALTRLEGLYGEVIGR